jgi:2-polyprenyl-3-methyl-5-hydroxy-6-metoxy-1,4-benzoquinol methylase
MSDPTFELIDCPVCHGTRFQSLFKKQREPFVSCDDCGLVLINPRPRFEAVAATYDTGYSRGYIDKAAKKIARCRRWVNRIVRRHGPVGRWLDVGCSAGFVVAAAEEAGFDAFGVELEPAAVEYGRRELGLTNLAIGTFEAQAYPRDYFDVISMYDVIEHVPDLNGTVAELARVLKPTGVIEIRTPDVGHWSTPTDLSTWKEIKPSEHLYYFNLATLSRLFAQHGLHLQQRRLMFKSALDCFFVLAAPGKSTES